MKKTNTVSSNSDQSFNTSPTTNGWVNARTVGTLKRKRAIVSDDEDDLPMIKSNTSMKKKEFGTEDGKQKAKDLALSTLYAAIKAKDTKDDALPLPMEELSGQARQCVQTLRTENNGDNRKYYFNLMAHTILKEAFGKNGWSDLSSIMTKVVEEVLTALASNMCAIHAQTATELNMTPEQLEDNYGKIVHRDDLNRTIIGWCDAETTGAVSAKTIRNMLITVYRHR